MRHKMAITKNVVNLRTAYEALAQREYGVEGMGLVFGLTGAGKTTAISWLRNQTNAVHVRALRTWTPRTMLESILTELGAAPLYRTAHMVHEIVRRLVDSKRDLFVDEVEYLIGNPKEAAMLDSLRDVYDLSKMSVLLIGHEGMDKRVVYRPQLARRITQWVGFLPTDIDDATVLAETVCEVEIEDALLGDLHASAKGNTGLMVNGMARIEAWAKANSKRRVTRDQWGNRPFFLAQSIGPRK